MKPDDETEFTAIVIELARQLFATVIGGSRTLLIIGGTSRLDGSTHFFLAKD